MPGQMLGMRPGCTTTMVTTIGIVQVNVGGQMTERNKKFDRDYSKGIAMEKLFDTFMIGYQVEIKSERHIWESTKNHFVEFSYLPFGKEDIDENWEDSGIAATTSTYWALMLVDKNEQCIATYFVLVEDLKNLAREIFHESGFVRGGDDNRSKGVKVPIERIAAIPFNR